MATIAGAAVAVAVVVVAAVVQSIAAAVVVTQILGYLPELGQRQRQSVF